MKKIMLILPLIGFSTTGILAQNNSYMCTQKIVHNNPIAIIDGVPTTGSYVYYSHDTEVQTFILVPNGPFMPASPTESCAVKNPDRSPGITYKSDDKNVYEYNAEGIYLGYFPVSCSANTPINVPDTNMTCVLSQPAPATTRIIQKWVVPVNAPDKNCSPQ